MELVSAVMSPLIKKLGELAVSELTLEKSVQQDVASLHRELKTMHLALQRVEVPPEQLDQAIVEWAANVRELSYDMEDAIEAFTLHVGENDDPAAAGLRGRLRGFVDKTARLFSRGKALHQVSHAVSEAKRLAKELGEINQRYAGLKQKDAGGASSSADIDPRLTAMYTKASDLIGIEDMKDELIQILSDPSEVDILHQLDKEEFKDINEAVRDVDQLTHDLKGYLQSKRYLIVIDDLWDETDWKFIKCAFPKNTYNSRLIITTRKHKVSETSCSSDGDIIYKMKPLSDDDSLRLFHSRIFHRGDTCPPELEQVSNDILKKCGGVPLAIITIASLLARPKHVEPKDKWLILLKSIGHGLKGCWRVDDMHKILSLSYYDLPSHMKPCLLYLSIFPEDYEIERDRLIWRWIAEGFIQQHENPSLFDNLFEIGESYFIELVNRSMIQPVDIDIEGRAKACRVHDLVLDLIRFLSRKENFVTVWDKDERATSSHSVAVARMLSIQYNTTTHHATITNMSKVRSFTIFSPVIQSIPSLRQFQVMRVLDLEGCDLSHLKMRHVGKLFHLRYLGLRDTRTRKLPAALGKLQFLQTLDVTGCGALRELPRTINGLRNLKRLYLSRNTRLPKGFGNLTSLEELCELPIDDDDSTATVVKELGHLTGLRVLKLLWMGADTVGEALVQSLGNMRKLQSLYMSVYQGSSDVMCDWAPPPPLRRFLCTGLTSVLPTLPAWMKNNSLSLTFVDISLSQVRPEDLQALGALSSLRAIRLWSQSCFHNPQMRMKVNAGGFPSTRACAFLDFATVPSIFAPGAMLHVQQLEFCIWVWKFTSGGSGFGLEDLRMGHLPSLVDVEVDLWYMHENDAAVVERVEAALRQAAEDHPNRIALRVNKCMVRSRRSWAWE
ncbi:hypothetical protein QOZ80_1BG0051670 [Eleusine coracana subsp. coracana]|nr:hypothetical protein QOZ80_1BG0051670 [Eleusine coracana subsp. coracana]